MTLTKWSHTITRTRGDFALHLMVRSDLTGIGRLQERQARMRRGLRWWERRMWIRR